MTDEIINVSKLANGQVKSHDLSHELANSFFLRERERMESFGSVLESFANSSFNL